MRSGTSCHERSTPQTHRLAPDGRQPWQEGVEPRRAYTARADPTSRSRIAVSKASEPDPGDKIELVIVYQDKDGNRFGQHPEEARQFARWKRRNQTPFEATASRTSGSCSEMAQRRRW